VYDADGLAPDLAGIPSSRHWFFGVLAASMWNKKEKVLRPVKLHELFAIWDFEGKLENQFNNRKQAITMLQHRLYSLPGKLIRLIGHHLLDQRAAYFDSIRPPPHVVTNKAVKSEDVPFTPLEDLAEVRAEAACPDDAEIDLSTWALPQETPEQFHSRNVLRRFAVRWWSYIITPRRPMSGWQLDPGPSLMSWLWRMRCAESKPVAISNGSEGVASFIGGSQRSGITTSEMELSFYSCLAQYFQKGG
jgi:hypothetical protein